MLPILYSGLHCNSVFVCVRLISVAGIDKGAIAKLWGGLSWTKKRIYFPQPLVAVSDVQWQNIHDMRWTPSSTTFLCSVTLVSSKGNLGHHYWTSFGSVYLLTFLRGVVVSVYFLVLFQATQNDALGLRQQAPVFFTHPVWGTLQDVREACAKLSTPTQKPKQFVAGLLYPRLRVKGSPLSQMETMAALPANFCCLSGGCVTY